MTNYREIPEDRILKFKSTAGFKGWKPFFSDESISHPAKMNLKLLQWILSKYTKPSETVLDPMSGTGSTIVLASMMGRNGVAVEFEPKFCEMIQNNIARVEKQATLIDKGSMKCYQGDARELSKILEESDAIITSPPYGNRLSDVAIHDDDPARMGYRQTVDVVLTSPPYEDSLTGGGQREKEGFNQGHTRGEHCFKDGYSKVDSIISSPPYGSDNANLQARKDKSAQSVLASTGVRGVELDPENLGNLEYGDIDAVVMSPPYESGRAFQDIEFMKDTAKDQSERVKKGEIKGHYMTEEARLKVFNKIEKGIIDNPDNIGNLKGETYLEAMIRVYKESFKVLKPLGKMVLVTKNFIRDKTVVRLDLDTIKLCEKAGFKLVDRWYFELPTKSFWKILYHRKYPSVSEVKYEDILVFEKNLDIKGEMSKNGN